MFGASTAQGYWDSQGGWSDRLKRYYDSLQLQAFKKQDFANEQPKVMNLGISDDGTKKLLSRLDTEASARQNAKGIMFIFSIGTNNAAVRADKNLSTPAEYRTDLESLINKAQHHSSKIMFVGMHAVDESLTTPFIGGDLYFRNERIFEFEKVMREVCAEKNIPHVAVFESFQDEAVRNRRLLAHDGLHPNDEGHELIFRLVRPVLDEVLGG